jgi:hypothetical protein
MVVLQLFKSGTSNRKREFMRKGEGKGWFTITLIIEFCKLNHPSPTTEAKFKEQNGNPTAFHECFPQFPNSKVEQPIGKESTRERGEGRGGSPSSSSLSSVS